MNSTDVSTPAQTQADAEGAREVATPALRPRSSMRPDALMDAWSGVALRAGAVLRDPASPEIEARIQRLDSQLCELVLDEPDGSLVWLVQHNTSEPHNYSVLHALLVAVVCDLAAGCVGMVSTEMRASMRRAALTMNLSITRLQDELVQQQGPLSPEQREAIEGHGSRAAACLRESGVSDALWLDAVTHHHDAPSGALAGLPPSMQLARLIQQADIFAARLSPRRERSALAANDAARGVYFDERKAPDEAGAAVIKAVGVYAPGSFVRLRNGEVAVVVQRGELASQPRVASVASAQGMPFSHPQRRDARLPEHAVVTGLPPHEMRVRVALAPLLRLAR